jgi:hypothetical protein
MSFCGWESDAAMMLLETVLLALTGAAFMQHRSDVRLYDAV